MAVSTNKGGAGKSHQNKKPRVKQVLCSPYEDSWPRITELSVELVKAQLQESASDLQDSTLTMMKPKWNVLKSLKKPDRKAAIVKFHQEHLESMTDDERSEFEKKETLKEEKLSHLIFGYNQIMRAVQKDQVAALLVNKSSTPEFLGMSFLPACAIKNIPVVPIENLGQLVRKCIAVGLKKSVLAYDSCFYSLYQKMAAACKISDDENLRLNDGKATGKQSQCIEDFKTGSSKTSISIDNGKYPPPPDVDLSKFLLHRTRTNHRIFIPNVGINHVAAMDDVEFITLPEISSSETATNTPKSFSFRSRKPKYTYKRRTNENNIDPPSKHENKRNGKKPPTVAPVDVSELQSDMMFVLDIGGSGSVAEATEIVDDAKENTAKFQPVKSEETENENTAKVGQSTLVTSDLSRPGTEAVSKQSIDDEPTPKKRKITAYNSVYIPAAVKRIVANVKRKK